MNSVIFQGLDRKERSRAIRDLVAQTDSSVVILSSSISDLVGSSNLIRRSASQMVRLSLQPDSYTDSFNPFDVIRYALQDPDDAIPILLEPLTRLSSSELFPLRRTNEAVWQVLASEMIDSVARYLFRRRAEPPSPQLIINTFYQDGPLADILAAILKHEGKLIDPNTHSVFLAYTRRDRDNQSAIESVIHERMSRLNIASVQRAAEKTTFDLDQVVNGQMTIYVEMLPALWRSHGLLARLWLSALLHLVAGGPVRNHPVLFVVDHAAELDLFPQLLASQQLPSETVEVWSFWESLSQIRVRHPVDWSAFLGGCRTVQALGPQSSPVAVELAEVFNVSVRELSELSIGRPLKLAGDAPELCVELITAESRPVIPQGCMLTFASARADKWSYVNAAILERMDGTVIVIEPAGKCHATTAAERATRGRVVRLDPFGVLGEISDQFNPLDLMAADGRTGVYDAACFAELLLRCGTPSIDPFWKNSAASSISAVLQYLFCVPEKVKTLGELWRTFHSDDVVYNLAVVLDTIGKRLPEECYRQIEGLLRLSDNTRCSVISHVVKSLVNFGSNSVQRAVEKTTFDLDEVVNGQATIYIEIPSPLWRTHGLLARLWFSALIHLTAGGPVPRRPVLFVVDHAAELDLFTQLLAALRLPSETVEVWSFWESLGQIRVRHPADWSAFIGGCRTVQALGPHSSPVAAELAEVFDVSNRELREVAPGLPLRLAGDAPTLPANLKTSDAARGSTEGCIVTFARARSDKWGHMATAINERPDRTVIVVESAGKCYAATAAGRAADGRIVRLDPFGVLGETSDQFNPLDLLIADGEIGVFDALHFGEMLLPRDPSTVDPYWRSNSASLISATLGYLQVVPEKECSIVELRKVLSSDDVVYNFSVILDTLGKRLPGWCYAMLAAFLQKGDAERNSLLAIASQALRSFGDPRVAETVRKTSFDISDSANTTATTIYIELPVLRLDVHSLLVQLWLESFLGLTTIGLPSRPLWVVDSPLSAALFQVLKIAQSTGQADVWTFWESLGQLQSRNPSEWSAFLSNAETVEALGPQNPVVAKELAAVFDCPPHAVECLSPTERLKLN